MSAFKSSSAPSTSSVETLDSLQQQIKNAKRSVMDHQDKQQRLSDNMKWTEMECQKYLAKKAEILLSQASNEKALQNETQKLAILESHDLVQECASKKTAEGAKFSDRSLAAATAWIMQMNKECSSDITSTPIMVYCGGVTPSSPKLMTSWSFGEYSSMLRIHHANKEFTERSFKIMERLPGGISMFLTHSNKIYACDENAIVYSDGSGENLGGASYEGFEALLANTASYNSAAAVAARKAADSE